MKKGSRKECHQREEERRGPLSRMRGEVRMRQEEHKRENRINEGRRYKLQAENHWGKNHILSLTSGEITLPDVLQLV